MLKGDADMKYKNIFWDWNGTILDDTSVAFEATNILLEKHGYPKITLEFYRDNVDTPIINFYSKIFDLSKENMESLDNEWGVIYNRLSHKIGLQNGVKDTLELFKSNNCMQVILSAFKTEEIHKYAHGFSVEHYFKDILGTENIVMESKLVRGKRYMEENNLSPQQTLYIGDTVHDFATARELGTDCILISCGQQSPGMLQQCNAAVCDSFESLNKLLAFA